VRTAAEASAATAQQVMMRCFDMADFPSNSWGTPQIATESATEHYAPSSMPTDLIEG
jgi:hypothetical protein